MERIYFGGPDQALSIRKFVFFMKERLLITVVVSHISPLPLSLVFGRHPDYIPFMMVTHSKLAVIISYIDLYMFIITWTYTSC
jgi:hypothetical protein